MVGRASWLIVCWGQLQWGCATEKRHHGKFSRLKYLNKTCSFHTHADVDNFFLWLTFFLSFLTFDVVSGPRKMFRAAVLVLCIAVTHAMPRKGEISYKFLAACPWVFLSSVRVRCWCFGVILKNRKWKKRRRNSVFFQSKTCIVD